jgi:predicted DsbA family dithiol-disulfide isomerase
MRIDIVSDTVCPWCFVGKRRLERAMAQRPKLEFEVHWHPFQLNPDVPAGGVDRDTYYAEKFGGRERVAAITEQLAAVGAELDIHFDFDAVKIQPNTRLSHGLIAIAEGPRQSAVKEAILSAFFEQGRDIGNLEVLVTIAHDAGLDADQARAQLCADALKAQIAERAEMARSAGISGVPTFIFDGSQGLSGAQPEHVFLEVFDQLTRNGNPDPGS